MEKAPETTFVFGLGAALVSTFAPDALSEIWRQIGFWTGIFLMLVGTGLFLRDWFGSFSRNIKTTPYNMTAHDVFRHILVNSKWASGKHDPDGMNPLGSSLLEQVDNQLREAANEGQIRVWGRQITGSALPQVRVQIPKEYWQNAGFDPITCWMHLEVSPKTWVRRGAGTEYEDIAFNRHEVLKFWPVASWLRRYRDAYLNERDNPAFDEAERKGIKWRVDGISA